MLSLALFLEQKLVSFSIFEGFSTAPQPPITINSLVKRDGFSQLFDFAAATFMKQAFALFAVRNAGFLSNRYISQGELEQFNETVLRGFAICALCPVPLRNNRQKSVIRNPR